MSEYSFKDLDLMFNEGYQKGFDDAVDKINNIIVDRAGELKELLTQIKLLTTEPNP